jgi:lipopolysaccharide biosynthesis glycosyltransferase
MTDVTANDEIHVVLTFDGNFWAPAFALMRSICLSTKRRADLRFHLCVQGVGDECRADLSEIETEFGGRLYYYDLSQSAEFLTVTAPLRLSRRFPPVTYARLLLDRILPASVERVIYLDCDTFVLKPIERLYDQDMHGNPVAAVADPFAMRIMMGRDMRAKQGIFDPAEPYFNSGVMLIDVKLFGQTDIPARLVELHERGIMDRLYFDQDMLNVIFRGRWTELNWRFNTIDPRRAQEAMGPYVVHYTGNSRPWHLFSLVPFHHTYRHAMTNELFYRFMRFRWKQYWLKKLRRLAGRK